MVFEITTGFLFYAIQVTQFIDSYLMVIAFRSPFCFPDSTSIPNLMPAAARLKTNTKSYASKVVHNAEGPWVDFTKACDGG